MLWLMTTIIAGTLVVSGLKAGEPRGDAWVIAAAIVTIIGLSADQIRIAIRNGQ
jgi:hypothetical protein